MGVSWGTAHWRWIGNGLLLLQFPLAHSFLLSGRGRVLLRGLAPAGLGGDLSTTTYVIVASLQIILLFGFWSPSGIIWWRAEGWVLALMIALYAAGWLLLLKSMFDAGITLQTGALGWWAVYRNTRPAYPPMPTRGLFRICRQPIYVSFAITLWTVPVWTPDQFVLAVVLSAYCLAGPLLKEARFTRMFGSEFEAYRARHPVLASFSAAVWVAARNGRCLALRQRCRALVGRFAALAARAAKPGARAPCLLRSVDLVEWAHGARSRLRRRFHVRSAGGARCKSYRR